MAIMPHSEPRRLPLVACEYELGDKNGVSRLCGRKPALVIIHMPGQGNLYLAKCHATEKRLAYAREQGYSVRYI
jgi:hypothetical protein